MADETKSAPLVSLRRERDRLIDRLSEHFARDDVDVDEFERRVDLAHRATTSEALARLTDDLEPLDLATEQKAAETALARRAEAGVALSTRPARRSVVAILSGAERKGQWRLPERLRVFAVLGGVELDFREVVFPPGVTEVQIYCVMGGCEVIVPPHVHVESDGIGVMGGFETYDRVPATVEPDEPILRIRGFALMGGFAIETRRPGESRREARRRRKRELKDGGPRAS